MDTKRQCERHPDQPYVRCLLCKTDAMAAGDRAALAAWNARIHAAACDEQFPPRFREATADHPKVAAWIEAWHGNPAECPSLLLVGTVGTGKTWQAYGALRAAVTGPKPATWIATTAADLYAALRPAPKRDTEAEMARYRDTGLLLIDDLGTAKTSEWVEEITYRVIGGRYDACKPSIFTTNLPLPLLREAVGDRIASRLAETCTTVALTGPDRRRVKAAA